MSGITLAQAQTQLDALLAAQVSNVLVVRYGDRTVTYRSMDDLQSSINYWSRLVAERQRTAAGLSRHGFKLASFQAPR